MPDENATSGNSGEETSVEETTTSEETKTEETTATSETPTSVAETSEEKDTSATTSTAEVAGHLKSTIVASKKYAKYADILEVKLEEAKMYTLEEVDDIVHAFLTKVISRKKNK